MVEVEVVHEVPEYRHVLAHHLASIRPAVGTRIQPLTLEKVVFDELGVRVEAQRLMIDVAPLGVGADDQSGNAQSVTVVVDPRRNDVVIEAAPVVPGEEDGR